MFKLKTVIISRTLICLQVQYIFLYALNLTQCITDACCIIVGCTDSWTDRRTDMGQVLPAYMCPQTPIHKHTRDNGFGMHESSTTHIHSVITLVEKHGDMPGPLARCSAPSTDDEWICSHCWKATSSVRACICHIK
jgi:hypothetical protein